MLRTRLSAVIGKYRNFYERKLLDRLLCQSVKLFAHLFVCLFVCLFVWLLTPAHRQWLLWLLLLLLLLLFTLF